MHTSAPAQAINRLIGQSGSSGASELLGIYTCRLHRPGPRTGHTVKPCLIAPLHAADVPSGPHASSSMLSMAMVTNSAPCWPTPRLLQRLTSCQPAPISCIHSTRGSRSAGSVPAGTTAHYSVFMDCPSMSSQSCPSSNHMRPEPSSPTMSTSSCHTIPEINTDNLVKIIA